MPWRGATQPITGLITGVVAASQVNAFSIENILTEMTFRLSHPPGAGTSITVRLQNNEAGDDLTEEVILSNLETFKQSTGLSMSVGTLWLEISAVSGSPMAMNLSGEYVMNSVVGVDDPFTTLARVKLDGKITSADADRDTVLNAMIAGVTIRMQNWIGLDIVQATTTEKLSGHDRIAIQTSHYPLIEITTLVEAGVTLVDGTNFESINRDLELGQIIRINGIVPVAWPKGRRNVTVTYDHGYVNIPESLVDAATKFVLQMYNETAQSGKGWGGLLSKGVDPASSTTYDKKMWVREIIPAMMPFRRVAV